MKLFLSARYPISHKVKRILAVSLLSLFAACASRQGDESDKTNAFGVNFFGVPKKEFLVDNRSSVAYFKGKSKAKRPLVLFLHGFGNDPEPLARMFEFPKSLDKHDFILLIPKGTLGAVEGTDEKKLYWNATKECCGLEKPDDVGYLTKLVKQVSLEPNLNIDPAQVYVFGYSNGGFMAHTLACKHAEMFKGIISYAGTSHSDESLCQPSGPVNVLQVHGTKDQIIRFDNPSVKPENPSVPWFPPPRDIINRWAKRNQCSPKTKVEKIGIMDLNFQSSPGFGKDAGVTFAPGGLFNSDKETDVEVFQDCQRGNVAFWIVNGGTHFNLFNPGTFDKAFEFVK